jgi:hypothetical protein
MRKVLWVLVTLLIVAMSVAPVAMAAPGGPPEQPPEVGEESWGWHYGCVRQVYGGPGYGQYTYYILFRMLGKHGYFTDITAMPYQPGTAVQGYVDANASSPLGISSLLPLLGTCDPNGEPIGVLDGGKVSGLARELPALFCPGKPNDDDAAHATLTVPGSQAADSFCDNPADHEDWWQLVVNPGFTYKVKATTTTDMMMVVYDDGNVYPYACFPGQPCSVQFTYSGVGPVYVQFADWDSGAGCRGYSWKW